MSPFVCRRHRGLSCSRCLRHAASEMPAAELQRADAAKRQLAANKTTE
jgi:hypothetical protein